jgi:YidC/Oxa1 family membrane protein insertase
MIEAPKIQAKVKELQKKYGHDKKKLNEELLRFYQENKVDPFGGCLPLIIQIPIFWALFRMLLTNKDLKGASFYFIHDLSLAPSHFPLAEIFTQFILAFPYYFLLVLTIVTTYLPTKLVSSDPRQEKFALMMNVFLAFICWRLPAGVMLYWATTNVLGLIQQYIQMKMVKEEE